MGNDGDNLRQRQKDELEVLKAIYVGDVIDNVQGPDAPIKFSVRLLPTRGGSSGGGKGHKVLTFLILDITIPLQYPQRVPLFSFGESKGLSSQEIIELETELNYKAKENIGAEMLYQLIAEAETFLYTHQKRSVGSFHDEMIMRQKQLEEKNLKKQIDLKEKERMAIKEEILRKRQEEQEELRKIKERRFQANAAVGVGGGQGADDSSPPLSPNGSPVKGDSFPSSFRTRTTSNKRRLSIEKRKLRSNSEGSDSSLSESSDLTVLELTAGKTSNIFFRGEILGKSERGTTVYAGMQRSGGALVAISEWKFIAKLDKKGKEIKSIIGAGDNITIDSALKQLHNFEAEMNLLQKLEHPNIILYFGMKAFATAEEPGVIHVYTAQEFVRGTTLQSYLRGTLIFDIALVRHCAQGVLEGLKYLHDNDIVHRFLRDSSIFVDSDGGVRLTDYGLERKICELFQAFHKLPDISDKFPPSIGRGGKKGDIYRFGVIILSLVNGKYETQNPPKIPSSLPLELQDFLQRCLNPIEHSRYTATQLLGHDFLKVPLGFEPALKLPCTNKNDNQKSCLEEDEDEEIEELPQFISRHFQGQSRVKSEFDILKWLGKGGFGDVLKARNKLDGQIYALKRIRLNPKNKQWKKKITREVKLLSQLNHENVVRYFNSWIETVVESDEEDTNDSQSTATKSPAVHFKEKLLQQNSLGIEDNIEAFAPAIQVEEASEWYVSESSGGKRSGLADSDSDESSDDEDLFGVSFRRITMEDSDEVVFENSDSTQQSTNNVEEIRDTQNDKSPSTPSAISLNTFMRESQFLYIQMEFCEKSTLKTAIDDNLCEDLDRAWRLFREIIEGIVHIHMQGMIHRDLKPVNIFLDSNDHVKIGDFGLATSSIIPKRSDETNDLQELGSQTQSIDFDETQTGQVGTALYVAPELVTTEQKASYNQKVDIYSLGIMLFEMFYHPMSTGMERIRVIMALRQKSIIFPKDFDTTLFPQVTFITRWLLNHDHTKRPTSQELLQSDYLPPPHLEEAELRDMFSRTLRSSKTKSYKFLVASCFQQEVSPVEDATYDMDGGKLFQIGGSRSSPGNLSKSLYFFQRVKSIVQKVFEKHGATEFQAPLLMPKASLYEDYDTCVNLMNHSGLVVSIPHDLRVSFARYVGRYGVRHMKRFTIDKVYRERKVYGLHPRELWECAYDIIDSSQGSLISDAESLSVVFEILRELPWFRTRNFTIRLGHRKLLQGVMLHNAVDEKHYSKITQLLSEVKNERDSKQQIETHLCSLGLPDHFVQMLLNLMEVEGSFSKISSILKGIMKRKSEAGSCIKEALHELEILINNIETFGLKCNVTVAPAMTFCSQIYSGLLFQVVCDLKHRKNKMTVDVIAAGGRYDNLIQSFRTSMYLEQDGNGGERDEYPCGVGISISLEKLIAGFEPDEEEGNEKSDWGQRGSVDVLICTLGHYQMTKEKIDMMKELLAHGIHASVLDGSQTLESAEEFYKETGASFLFILKEGEYFSNVRVRMWEHGRFNEKKMSKAEAIDFVVSRALNDGNDISSFAGASGLLRSDSLTVKQGGSLGADVNCPLSASNCTHGHHNHVAASSALPPYNISIIIQEREKLTHSKRRFENQVMSRITDILAKLGKQQTVEILGLDVNSTVVNNLASSLSVHDKEEFTKNVGEVIEKHPRLKKYLKTVCDEIFDLIYTKNSSIVIIYGLTDNSYRVLI